MVRPANFGFNEETAASNAFQTNDDSLSNADVSRLALAEFDAFVDKLRSVGVEPIEVVAPWCSDGSYLQQLGPCMVWGPSSR